MQNVKCWDCQYCDKESTLIHGQWLPTKTGYCMAEKSAANGQESFYEKVYANTVQAKCELFVPKK